MREMHEEDGTIPLAPVSVPALDKLLRRASQCLIDVYTSESGQHV
jgi:hypothetical protein